MKGIRDVAILRSGIPSCCFEESKFHEKSELPFQVLKKNPLRFSSVAPVFAPLSAIGSSKLRSSEATVTPRSSEFKNYCHNDGIEQPRTGAYHDFGQIGFPL